MENIRHIIKQCIERDRAAQKLLYQRYKSKLMSIAYRYCQDLATAQDVLQNGFMKIFLNLEKFDHNKGNFEGWMTRIIINEALQLKRKRKELYLEDQVEMAESFTEMNNLDKLTIEELSFVIDRLPEAYKVIINLYYFDEYSHNEIASILDIKASSSRGQLSRARKELNKQWELYNLESAQ